jgi:hypothetical protein
MEFLKELEGYVKKIMERGIYPENGEDAAGYANAVLMMVRAIAMLQAIEQSKAMNRTSPLMEVLHGKAKPDTTN